MQTKTIKTLNYQIIPTTISDHDSVSVIIHVNIQTPKGPGIWKLNTTILKQKQAYLKFFGVAGQKKNRNMKITLIGGK